MKKPGGGRGRTRKHSGAHGQKHASGSGTLHGKHNPGHHPKGQHQASGPGTLHTVGKHPAHPKPRQFSPGSDVACCSAEALGQIFVASGRPWSYEQTLALYWRTASHPDSGASIPATLEAAQALTYKQTGLSLVGKPLTYKSAWVLGVTLPEPHAVAVMPDGTWWSWGEPFDPDDWPELVIEEAWAVSLCR